MANELVYRIAWKYLNNEISGHGEYCMTRELADMWLENLNSHYKNTMTHWMEGVPRESIPLSKASLMSSYSSPASQYRSSSTPSAEVRLPSAEVRLPSASSP